MPWEDSTSPGVGHGGSSDAPELEIDLPAPSAGLSEGRPLTALPGRSLSLGPNTPAVGGTEGMKGERRRRKGAQAAGEERMSGS